MLSQLIGLASRRRNSPYSLYSPRVSVAPITIDPIDFPFRRQLHLELTRIAHDINGAFCLQILLELTVHFTIVTVVSYTLYSVLAGTTSRMAAENEKIVAMVVWGAVYSIKIIYINNLCTTTSYEVSIKIIARIRAENAIRDDPELN